jgi:hypothetical protein
MLVQSSLDKRWLRSRFLSLYDILYIGVFNRCIALSFSHYSIASYLNYSTSKNEEERPL